ncbi:MAG: hypothetical protein JWN52_3588 [Actinomycetia bacterium]|nr:hypothetical protein [Actinomycetes bacterium]
MGDLPNDPVSALAEGAAQLHELYLAFISAGFTESQALYLVGQQIQASSR